MRFLFALLLAAAAIAAPPAPRLAISIERAITRPGRNGKGDLIRPLVLILSNWEGTAPGIEAYSYAGTVKAECLRLNSPAGQWNANVKYAVTEEVGKPPFQGEVRLRLKIDGAIVRGGYQGTFNGMPLAGQPGAGIVFEHMYQPPHQGLLLWLPHLQNEVKGIVIWGNGANLDDRQAALREELQAFAAANSLALIGTGEMNPWMSQGEGLRILDGLKALAAMSGHPELEYAPIFFMGHSNGGAMSVAFNQWLPSRVAGFVASHGSVGPGALSPEAKANPGVLTAGEVDQKIPPEFIERLFKGMRAQGAHVCLVVEQAEDHPPGAGSMPFFLFFLQRVAEQRLPRGASAAHGPVKLLPLDAGRAWLADNATWKQGIARIVPAAGFSGDAAAMSWLLDKDVAFLYRGIATYNNPLKLERAAGHGAAYLRNEPVTVEATALGEGKWKSIALYDGAVRLGAITRGQPRLVLPAQKPGAHAGVLVGELPNGDWRTSLPVSWVVWP